MLCHCTWRLDWSLEILHGVDSSIPEQEVQHHPHQTGAKPLKHRLRYFYRIIFFTHHNCVSAHEVSSIKTTFQFVEVLSYLHISVLRKEIPDIREQRGWHSSGVISESSKSTEKYFLIFYSLKLNQEISERLKIHSFFIFICWHILFLMNLLVLMMMNHFMWIHRMNWYMMMI